jgi:hypothetical protein
MEGQWRPLSYYEYGIEEMDRHASRSSSPNCDQSPSSICSEALVIDLAQVDDKVPAVRSGSGHVDVSFTRAPGRVSRTVNDVISKQSKNASAADFPIPSSLPITTTEEMNSAQCIAAELDETSGHNVGLSTKRPPFTPLGASKESTARLMSGNYEEIDLTTTNLPVDIGGGLVELVRADTAPAKMFELGMSISNAELRVFSYTGTLTMNIEQHQCPCKQILKLFQVGLPLLTTIDPQTPTLQPGSIVSPSRMISVGTNPSHDAICRKSLPFAFIISGGEDRTLASKPSLPKQTEVSVPTDISDEEDLPIESTYTPHMIKMNTVLTTADSPSQPAKGTQNRNLRPTKKPIPPVFPRRNWAPAETSEEAEGTIDVAVKGLVNDTGTTVSRVAQESVPTNQPTGDMRGTALFARRAAGDQNPELGSKGQYKSPWSLRQSQATVKTVSGADGNDSVVEAMHNNDAHVAKLKLTQKSILSQRSARKTLRYPRVRKRPTTDRIPALEPTQESISSLKEAGGLVPKRQKISPAETPRRTSRKVNRDVNYNMEVHPQDVEMNMILASEARGSNRSQHRHRSDDSNTKNRSDDKQEKGFGDGASVILGPERSQYLSVEPSSLVERSVDVIKMGHDEDADIAASDMAFKLRPARNKKGGGQNPAANARGRPKGCTNVPRATREKPEVIRSRRTPSFPIAQPEVDEYQDLFKLIPKGLSKLPKLADMIFTKHSRPGYISVRLFTGIFSCPRQKVSGLKAWTYFQPTDLPGGGSIVSCWAENGNEHTHIPIEAPDVARHEYLEQKADEPSKQVNDLVSIFDRCWPFSEVENRDEYVACAYFYLSHAARKKGASFDQYRVVWKKGLATSLEKLYKTAKRRHNIDNMPESFFSDFSETELEDFSGTHCWKSFPVIKGGSTKSPKPVKELKAFINNVRPSRDSISSIADATRGRSSRRPPADKHLHTFRPRNRSSSSDIIPWKEHDYIDEPIRTEEPLPTDPALLDKLRQEMIKEIRMKLKRHQVLCAKGPGLAPLKERNQEDLQKIKKLQEELSPFAPLNRLRVRLGVTVQHVQPWLGRSNDRLADHYYANH